MPRKRGSTNSSTIKKVKVTPELEKKLVENLVSLQKVHTDLAIKFDHLSKQISELLNLFESAARSFTKNPANLVTEKDKEFLDKIDKLLDQNKTIAKGLTIMEEKMRERMQTPPRPVNPNPEDINAQGRPLPKF